jgi:imidazolonepropionase-like amidohydrolase
MCMRQSVLSRFAVAPTVLLACVFNQVAAQQAATRGSLALKDVTVINVGDGQLHPGQSVVIAGNRIQAVGPVQQIVIPPGARVVEAKGKYLIPGLWDMHTHMDEHVELYPRFIAHGVTGIREIAQRFRNGIDSFRVWQREILAGTRVGPRVAGPSADLTDNSLGGRIRIKTPDDAVRILDSLKAAGVTFVKYHDSYGDPSLYFAILREARRVGLPLIGHTPLKVSEAEATDSGQRSIEHIIENHTCWPVWKIRTQDSVTTAAARERCAEMARSYIRNGTWFTPTIVIAVYVDQEFLVGRQVEIDDDIQGFIGMMRSHGVTRFLAGTDANTQGKYRKAGLQPGISLLQELWFLAESGLTPLEALQAATLHPAQFFEATDSLGTVVPGKLADLVLLDGNPLADIRNVMRIRSVVANGRYFDRAALDALDPEGMAQIAALTASPLNAKASTNPIRGVPFRDPVVSVSPVGTVE